MLFTILCILYYIIIDNHQRGFDDSDSEDADSAVEGSTGDLDNIEAFSVVEVEDGQEGQQEQGGEEHSYVNSIDSPVDMHSLYSESEEASLEAMPLRSIMKKPS